jgi:hypothetical protein
MAINNDFGQGGLLEFWNSMTTDQRNTMVANLEAFHALCGSLKGRGIIEVSKLGNEITVLKKHTDINILKALHKQLGAAGIKIIE